MSNDKNITIVAPPGFEPVYEEDGTVTFREVVEVPGREALEVGVSVRPGWSWASYIGGGWLANSGAGRPNSNDPTVRDIRPRRTVTVTIEHPDEAWVQQAANLLEDFAGTRLADYAEEQMS